MSRSALFAIAALTAFGAAPARAQSDAPPQGAPPMPIAVCTTQPAITFGTNPNNGNSGFAWQCGRGGIILSEVEGGQVAFATPTGPGGSLVQIARQGLAGVCLTRSVVQLGVSPDGRGTVQAATRYGFVSNDDIARMGRGETIEMSTVPSVSELPAEAVDCGGDALRQSAIDVTSYLGAAALREMAMLLEQQRRASPPPPPPVHRQVVTNEI